jgi:hypothetical protein
LYYSPRKFEFGEATADEHELVKAFLKTHRFVVTSPNAYNQLGLGTTQLYNKTGCLQSETAWNIFAGQSAVTFERRTNIPRQISAEFLLVDLVNELGGLAEDNVGNDVSYPIEAALFSLAALGPSVYTAQVRALT